MSSRARRTADQLTDRVRVGDWVCMCDEESAFARVVLVDGEELLLDFRCCPSHATTRVSHKRVRLVGSQPPHPCAPRPKPWERLR